MGLFTEKWKSGEETGFVKQFKLYFVHMKFVIPLFIQMAMSSKQLDM